MSERRQAAWDEAQRRYPTGDRQAGFVAGAAWADEKAHRAAEALDMAAIEATEPGEVRCGFRAGARWQREALLSDEAVERAARGIHSFHDRVEVFDFEYTEVQDDYRGMARAALAAAIGEDENDG